MSKVSSPKVERTAGIVSQFAGWPEAVRSGIDAVILKTLEWPYKRQRVETEGQAILTKDRIEGLKKMGSKMTSFELLDQAEPEVMLGLLVNESIYT